MKGVVVVLAVRNSFQDRELQGEINGFPERLADLEVHNENMILVGGIDKNSWISPWNPHRTWMAMAPGFGVWAAANTDVDDYEIVDGASYGKLPFFEPSSKADLDAD